MDPKRPTSRDENEEAARVVRDATDRPATVPNDLEAAWDSWSGHLQRVDARTMTLLRSAFEAGHESGRSALGRLGAKKGGDARAAKLSGKRRSEIAKKAARKRWGD
jgi:hypothetical protein